MATSEDITSGNTNSLGKLAGTHSLRIRYESHLSLSTDSCETKLICLRINLFSLNTSSHFDCWALILPAAIVLDILDLLKVVGPDTKGTSSSRLAIEIMTGILDNQSQTSIPGKIDSQLNLTNIAHVNGVAAVSTNRARFRAICCGKTAASLEQRPHYRGRISGTRYLISICPSITLYQKKPYWILESVHSEFNVLHFSASYSGHEE